MRRLYVRIVFIAAIASGIALIFLNTSPQVDLNKVLDISRLQPEHLPELLQRIRDFHRIVTRDGKKLLEVSAKEASYFRNEKAIEILEPKLVFYDEGRRVGAITGGRGYLLMDGNKVESVELSGQAEFQLMQFVVKAESIEYHKATDQVVTSGPTEVTSDEIELKGHNLTFDLSARTLNVNADVDMMLRPASDDSISDTDTEDRDKS
jgi:LPS export ABC transporter protein LptC